MLESKSNWDYINEDFENLPTTSIKKLDLSTITKKLLYQQGIHSEEAAQKFINPKLDYLHKPTKLSMMEKASERIQKAIKNNEKILIYGDYDADGVCSTTLLLKALAELEANCSFYIPNRFTEGYGPNKAAFQSAYDEGFRVIITVDSGIASFEEADFAKTLGLDLIITDHHEIQGDIPNAFAVINPKSSKDYPFQDLAGVGVAFKLAEELLGYFPKQLLDLVAVGTIADLVPLIDENRVLATYGLRQLTVTQNLGFQALKRICDLNSEVTEEDVGFLIGPRINAVGRLQDADLAVELLMTEDINEAMQIAEEIQLINEQRQQLVNKILVEAEQIMNHDPKEHKMIILAKKGWNEGVLGIVASRLVQKYNRPTIVLAVNEEESIVKGSARSISAFDLFESGMEIRELFTHFGGHSQAAGMTLPLENLQLVENKFNEFLNNKLKPDDFKQLITVNEKLKITNIDEQLIEEIDLLSPFGMKNPKPIFEIEQVPTDIRQIGQMQKHLKLQFQEGQTQLEGIGFSMGHLFKYISQNVPISIVGQLGINEWNGNRKLQIVMQDMKIDDWQLFDFRGRKNFDVKKYLTEDETFMIVSNDLSMKKDISKQNVEWITYETEIDELEQTDNLFIWQLPTELVNLESIIKKTIPNKIYACYHEENSTYLTSFTSRDAFKWYYGLIMKQETIDLKTELNTILNARKWTKERIVFMTKVFIELGFVTVTNGVVELNPNAKNRSLNKSKLYSQQINKANIEKQLYYSNYDELKEWFAQNMGKTAEEELIHEL